ncbi:hypothetical protein C8034_v011637 [Colletotrichum sidae]|uniref:Spo12-like protein n=2 Tax=Colletotrichum orbiculare species complex TaxID=2707354 RepID=A0A4R8PKZ7_9PEZI|nr:hypothetical protein C8035_v000013 [Colletotrichum spinosum]TEA17974.1 hypothetical protein C8034_v011637 [Colletotrichum sidae]
MSSNVLADKDVNAAVSSPKPDSGVKDVKSMEYHRQVLHNKMAQEKYDQEQPHHSKIQALNSNHLNRSKTYISPSDNLMSPCTAKLNALRNKQVGKVKPKSLFAQTSAKKLEGDALFGSRTPTKDDSL